DIGCQADIHARAQAARDVERQPAPEPAQAAEPLVSIREHIVYGEIESHRAHGRSCVAGEKPEVRKVQQDAEDAEVKSDADRAADAKGDETPRNNVAKQFVEHQHRVFPGSQGIKLALAGVTRTESVGQFLEAKGFRGRS